MAQILTQTSGTIQTIMSASLDALEINGNELADVPPDAPILIPSGCVEVEIQLTVTFLSYPIVNSYVGFWFLKSVTSGTFEDGQDPDTFTAPTPGRPPDVFFTLQQRTTQRITKYCHLPAGKYLAFLRNNSGRAFAASGNTIKIRPIINVVQ